MENSAEKYQEIIGEAIKECGKTLDNLPEGVGHLAIIFSRIRKEEEEECDENQDSDESSEDTSETALMQSVSLSSKTDINSAAYALAGVISQQPSIRAILVETFRKLAEGEISLSNPKERKGE